ncbi:UNVERIFIED_CONTAM: hypothetical protein K2H54_047944 [Gekko kuhli]
MGNDSSLLPNVGPYHVFNLTHNEKAGRIRKLVLTILVSPSKCTPFPQREQKAQFLCSLNTKDPSAINPDSRTPILAHTAGGTHAWAKLCHCTKANHTGRSWVLSVIYHQTLMCTTCLTKDSELWELLWIINMSLMLSTFS